jgi:dTDP-glucose 4,6-dehydratase
VAFDYVLPLRRSSSAAGTAKTSTNTLWRTNAIGTKNVIRLQEASGVSTRALLVVRSVRRLARHHGRDVMDEYEIKQMNDYAMTKWVNEMQIRNSARAIRHRERGRAHLQHVLARASTTARIAP